MNLFIHLFAYLFIEYMYFDLSIVVWALLIECDEKWRKEQYYP